MRNIKYGSLRDVAYIAGGGRAVGVELIRGVKTHALLLEVSANVTIVGAGGGTVNAEGISRMFDVQLVENGAIRMDLSGRMLGYLTSRDQMQPASVGALASAAAQAGTVIRAFYVLPFASIWGADPSEIAFVERDSRYPTNLAFTFAADPNAALISGTGLTLNSLTISTVQMYDDVSQVMPFFLPRVRRNPSSGIAGSPAAFRVNIEPDGDNRVASVVLHALVDGTTNNSVLTGLVSLRNDKVRYVDGVDFRILQNEARRFFPGITPQAGYLEIIMRTYGKLSEMYIPGQDGSQNLRAEVAATNPGTTAFFDAYTLELERVPGFTRDIPAGW